MKIGEIIDTAKKAARIESDMQLSKHLGLSKSAVANWRAGTSYPNTVSCERLAGLTGIPLARVLGIVGEARAISREEKSVWRKLAASAAAVFLLVGATPLPGRASDAPQASIQSAPDRHYAKLTAGRGILTSIRLVALWLRWRLSRRKPSPSNVEAFA